VCKIGNGDEASRDHLWLTEKEWRAMAPPAARTGRTVAVPPGVAERISRFHLIDNTRGEPPLWRKGDVRESEMKLTVQQADDAHVLLRLDGKALLATEPDLAGAQRGYDAALLGYVRYDRAKDRIDRFDVVALGEHWGEGTFTRGARPGRRPLGVAFELARGDKPGDAVPPQAAREQQEYFGAGR
jgi:hypothetical protein